MEKKSLRRILVFSAIIMVLFLPPFVKYQKMRYENKGLEKRLTALKEEAKRLGEEKRKLQTDITYVESKAREKMGVVRKGEIVLKSTPAKK